jgi:hypothetical protein
MAQGAAGFRSFVRSGACLLTLCLALGCVPMPVHWTPQISGQVLDANSGGPVEGAVVVVRLDARHGDLLPDRDLLGHREAVTDDEGRFRVARGVAPGLTAWPIVSTEARVVSVMRAGYRCAAPHAIEGGQVTLRIARSRDEMERRASCRPVAARPSEAPGYLAAWRALYPRDGRSGRMADERPLERLVDARRVFGPGQNCTGPVVDLALSPGGERVAVAVEQAGGRSVEVIELGGSKRVARVPALAEPEPRRLAWISGAELVLWEPADALDLALSSPSLGRPGGAPEVIWRGAQPPAPRSTPSSDGRAHPIEPADRNDAGDARWQGRAFHVVRSLDPESGLASETLHSQTPEGDRFAVSLPGEACGPPGQYGRPHLRIAADGQSGLDLRYVDGGCHAVVVHLTSGRWKQIDGSAATGACRETRRVPPAQLRSAMRGYTRDLEDALRAAGGDPGAPYRLRIDPSGPTVLEARSYSGAALELVVPRFPVETQLRSIEVTGVTGTGSAYPPVPPAALEPL